MKHILTLALSSLFLISANAQNDSVTLLPDQNPNFQKSRAKYMAQSVELTKNEGQTIQDTYKAIDDVQAKKDRKELALTRRHERRMARIQSRGYRRGGHYYNNGYGYNNYGYNNGYYGSPYSNYGSRPNYLNGPTFGTVNSVVNTALLGLTLWYILRH